jgi:hypothetical protein
VNARDTPLFKEYVRLLVRIAAPLTASATATSRSRCERAAVTPARWQLMLEVYKAIRERAPRLLATWRRRGGMKALGRRSKDRPRCGFPRYDPYQLPIGAPWVDAPSGRRPIRRRRAPKVKPRRQHGVDRLADLSPSENAKGRAAAPRGLSRPLDRAPIARSFDRVAQWAKDHGIPTSRIILGEFSARGQGEHAGGARSADRARWIRDVREEAEAHGFIWAAWVYRGSGGFALVRDEASSELDPAVSQALGLVRQ